MVGPGTGGRAPGERVLNGSLHTCLVPKIAAGTFPALQSSGPDSKKERQNSFENELANIDLRLSSKFQVLSILEGKKTGSWFWVSTGQPVQNSLFVGIRLTISYGFHHTRVRGRLQRSVAVKL